MNKQKTNNRSHIGISGHLQPTCPNTQIKVCLILLVLMVLYAGTAIAVGSQLHSDKKLQKNKQSLSKTENQVILPVIEPLRTEQEVIELKQKEVEIAGELLKNFPNSDVSLAIMGNVYYRHGNAIEALKFWKEALKINPKRADIYQSMGWSFLKMGEFDNAIEHYGKALDIQPQLPEVHSNIGHALMMSGRQNEAIEELKRELGISPSSSFAYFLLGQAYLQLNEYEKAKENYELAIKIKSDYTNAYYGLSTACAQLGDSDKANEYSATFKRLKTEGRKYMKGRKIQYDDFSETQKKSAVTYINVGQVYRASGKLQKAEELLKQAAGLDPNNIVCFLELSSLYQAKKQYEKAIQMQRRITEIQPESYMPHFIIGIFSAHIKRFEDAEQAFRKVITLAPKSAIGYRELARLYLKTKKELPQARQLAEKAVALEPNAASYFVLSWACYENGDIASAYPAIERALELDPANPSYQLFYKTIRKKNPPYGPYR